MLILIHADGPRPLATEGRADIEAMLARRLRRFASLFTRLEVYLGRNEGTEAEVEPWRCTIEGRIARAKPLKVEYTAARADLAAEGAAARLLTATERRVARRQAAARRGPGR